MVECDEQQHRGYSCETKRTMQLFQDCGYRPAVYIRFNPDSYLDTNGTRVHGCFHEDRHVNGETILTPLPEWEKRVKELCSVFSSFITSPPHKEVTEVKLFYNTN